jgi:excisionase family DNA binding protein
MGQSNHNSEVMTLRETAQFLRVSEMTLLRLVNRGVIPGLKLGRQWRFSRDTIADLIQKPWLLHAGDKS